MYSGLHGPGQGPMPVPGRYAAWHMRESFSNGLAHGGGDFSIRPGRVGPAYDRCFFQRAGPAKREMKFLTPGLATKEGRRIVFRVSPGGQNKEEILKPADKSLIMNLI